MLLAEKAVFDLQTGKENKGYKPWPWTELLDGAIYLRGKQTQSLQFKEASLSVGTNQTLDEEFVTGGQKSRKET